jgi:hypothetical protein
MAANGEVHQGTLRMSTAPDKDVPLRVPAEKPLGEMSLEMTPEDLDRKDDPREAQQVNRVILSGQGTAQNQRSTGGKCAPGGLPQG